MSERVEVITQDGVRIIGDHYPVKSVEAPAALLLHMMPADKKSWVRFAEKLQTSGAQALAIDLRGHGESVARTDADSTRTGADIKLDYRNFSTAEHQASIADVRAAHKWLKERGAAMLYLAGASIGANLALQHLAENREARAAVLLSPGINYHGIKSLPFAESLGEDKGAYVAGAKDDPNVPGNDKMCEKIFSSIDKANKQIKIFERGGHGTDILDAHPDFEEELIGFLTEK